MSARAFEKYEYKSLQDMQGRADVAHRLDSQGMIS